MSVIISMLLTRWNREKSTIRYQAELIALDLINVWDLIAFFDRGR